MSSKSPIIVEYYKLKIFGREINKKTEKSLTFFAGLIILLVVRERKIFDKNKKEKEKNGI